MATFFSATTKWFYDDRDKEKFETGIGWPADAVEVSPETVATYTLNPPAGKQLGSDSSGAPVWVDIPSLPNSELLKAALTSLSVEYQNDIEVLNRAWLAAAVNDGVNETTKKDAVLVQINARKSKYATDRAAVIAQYPV